MIIAAGNDNLDRSTSMALSAIFREESRVEIRSVSLEENVVNIGCNIYYIYYIYIFADRILVNVRDLCQKENA